MEPSFMTGQEVGILKEKSVGPQPGTIMKCTDDGYYHVLCRAIFPDKWVVYICTSDELLQIPAYKTLYRWDNLNEIYNYGHIYKQSSNKYYIREAVPINNLPIIGNRSR